MDICGRCGKEIRFIRRKGMKSLVVEKKTVFFVPDSYGEVQVISNGVMRRGTIVSDGLKGSILHNC